MDDLYGHMLFVGAISSGRRRAVLLQEDTISCLSVKDSNKYGIYQPRNTMPIPQMVTVAPPMA